MEISSTINMHPLRYVANFRVSFLFNAANLTIASGAEKQKIVESTKKKDIDLLKIPSEELPSLLPMLVWIKIPAIAATPVDKIPQKVSLTNLLW